MAFSAGSRSCIDSLKSDLRGIQGGLKEVLLAFTNREGLQVPSWRFPERLAVSLDIEEVLRNVVYSTGSEEKNYPAHVLLLELVVDRLILLLQCCLRLSDGNSGHKSATLPLTLGSAAKKFAKKFLNVMHSSMDLKNQVCTKDEKIASLELTTINLRENCKQLQGALHGSTPTTSFAQNNSNTSRPSTTSNILAVPSRPTSGVIPYEAEGTLRMNRLTMANTSRSLSSLRNEDLRDPSSGIGMNRSLLTSTPIEEESPNSTIQSSARESLNCAPTGVSTWTQTTETAFAVCARCSDTQDCLVSITASISDLCSKHRLCSALANTDWRALARVGGLELSTWERAFRKDVDSIEGYCSQLESRADKLALESDAHREETARIEAESKSLSSQIHSLQSAMHEIQQKNECSLAKSKETFASQLRILEETNSREEMRNARLNEELNGTQKQVTHFRALVAQLEHHQESLQSELQMVQGHELQLLSARGRLEEELSCVRGELEGYQKQLEVCQKQLEVRGVELSKMRVHNQTLNKKIKLLQGKQSSLLGRLDELDQECSSLHEQLQKAVTSRDDLGAEMERIQEECTQLQGRLREEESKLSQSKEEQVRLVQQVSELEREISEVRQHLQEERQRCKLLMDYPFAKQATGGSGGIPSQKQISANTIRILLLEEQNHELRERAVQAAQALRLEEGDMFQLKGPTPLWQRETLLKAQQELTPVTDKSYSHPAEKTEKRRTKSAASVDKHSKSSRRNCSPPALDSGHKLQPAPSSTATIHIHNQLERPSTNSKLRGRFGYLVEAIAQAHKSDMTGSYSSPPKQGAAWHEGSNVSLHGSLNSFYDDTEVCMCSKCDRMFHSKVELDGHLLACRN